MLEVSTKNMRFLSRMGSRGCFAQAIHDLAESGRDFVAVAADLGRSAGFDRISRQFPDLCVNVGIAEQNLIGVSGGLAKDGTPVFATTFASFASARCTDQVRILMGYSGLNIKLVGMDSGLIQAQSGATHYGFGDLAIMRSIPGITILSPADGLETYCATVAALEWQGPVYLRLTGGQTLPMIHKNVDFALAIGKAIKVREGTDVAFIGCGSILANALEAAALLEARGLSSTVIDMHTLRPLDREALDGIASHRLIVTVEEHTTHGGLGAAVAESLAPRKVRPPHLLVGIDDFFPKAGDYDYMIRQCGLTPQDLYQRVTDFLAV